MKKILLLCQQCRGYSIETSPARYQLVHELSKLGYRIYVFLPGVIRKGKIKDEIYEYTNTANLTARDIRNKIRKIMPEYVIGFTYEDAEILYPLPWVMKKTSFIYYNLEIYTPMEHYTMHGINSRKVHNWRFEWMYLRNKIKEIIFVKGCGLLIIQDTLRLKVLSEFFIRHSDTMLIPNSYVFHHEDRAAGCSGMVYSGGMNRIQLESLFGGIPTIPDIPIAFAGWGDEWFRRQCKRISRTHPNIQVYTKILQPQEFTEFLKQFAVGFIWYSPTEDKNINSIGLSSGKFFKHLSLGQPVITNVCPELSKVVKKYKLGIVIHDVSELQDAYDSIMENYMYYQNNVINVYKNKFDYKEVIRPFLRRLEEM